MFEYDGVTDALYERFLETLSGRKKVVASYCDYSASGKHRGLYYHANSCEHSTRLHAYFDADYYPNCYNAMRDELDELWMEFVEEQYRGITHEIYRTLEKEFEYLTSEEQIIETIICNGYEFLENGQWPRV
jgi:hypothetical protein